MMYLLRSSLLYTLGSKFLPHTLCEYLVSLYLLFNLLLFLDLNQVSSMGCRLNNGGWDDQQ